MHTDPTFRTWMRQKRKERGLTQETLAELAGCSTTYLKKIEAGQRQPTRQVVEALLDALGVPRDTQPTYIGLAFATTPTVKPPPTPSLPRALTSFIGRDRELAEIKGLLSAARLVTLTGPGGSGKTRLAVEVAQRIDDLPLTIEDWRAGARVPQRHSSSANRHFPDGVFFVDLAPITDPGLILSRVAQALDVREQPGQPLLDTLKDTLREKQTLLLLDNFEQVVEGAPLVADLLAAAPKVRALVTSREPLRLRGEHEYPVMPLPAPPRRDQRPTTNDEGRVADPSFVVGPALLAQYPASALFIERARAVKPDFQLTDANAPAVAEICRRLDGLPLALELAAARIRILPPEAMLARLDHRLRFLAGGPRDLHTRQQTLQNTIAWSYDLLSPAEQRFFRRLGVFVGGFTVEAAQAVCDADGALGLDALDGVESLVAKSLVRAANDGPSTTGGAASASSSGTPCFTLLETIREYAAEKLEASGEAEAVHAAHGRYFLARAEEAKAKLYGLEHLDWLNWLEAEHDNLRAALEWLRAAWPESGLRLAVALGDLWRHRGYWSEGWRRLEEMLAVVPAPTSTRARALNAAGLIALWQGNHGQARGLYEESLGIAHDLTDQRGTADALLGLGHVYHADKRYQEARQTFEQSLALYRAVGERRGEADALTGLGRVYVEVRDAAASQAHFTAALAIREELADRANAAGALFDLATLAAVEGRYIEAQALLARALTAHRELGDKGSIVNSLHWLGQLAVRQGEWDTARACLDEALPLAHELGKNWSVTAIIAFKYAVALTEDDELGARASLAELQSLARASASRLGAVSGLGHAGEILRVRGDYGRAGRLYEEAISLARGRRDLALASLLHNLAYVRLHFGDWRSAGELMVESIAINEEQGHQQAMLECVAGLGCVTIVQGDARCGARLLGAAEALLAARAWFAYPVDRAEYAHYAALAQAVLGDTEFEAAWSAGQAMTIEQAIAYALEETRTAANSNPPPSTRPRR